ncbi:MAG: FMN-binding protein [SAR324 cluster bacterium]|nr:FMN-binding protein [SAR324 cluster bacterium]
MELEAIPQESHPSSFRLIATLGIAGLFSGLVLVGVYLSTLPIIEANKAKALKEAVFHVVPGCQSFQTLLFVNGKLLLEKAENSENKEKQSGEVEKIFACYDQEKVLQGFAIPGSEPGFQDLIQGIFGYQAEKKIIIGFEVLESRETPGLGDKIIKDKNFIANFTALSVVPELVPVKPGSKQKKNQVETITGATISSKAVVRLLQNSINRWRPAIEEWAKAAN